MTMSPKCRTGKRRLRDEVGAKLALAEALARDSGEIRFYECMMCGGYHLTSQDKGVTPPGIDNQQPIR